VFLRSVAELVLRAACGRKRRMNRRFEITDDEWGSCVACFPQPPHVAAAGGGTTVRSSTASCFGCAAACPGGTCRSAMGPGRRL
jgi:hypothetical protein